jgi:2-oxoglutarate ferredoxin oxidoreductase subunit gamma
MKASGFLPAKNDIGREIVANVGALGATTALIDAVSLEAGEKVVLSRVPEAFLELDKKAYNMGFEKVKKLLK